MNSYDVIIIGGGPAGLAAGISACDAGSNVLLIERERQLGGILKQCVHDGFGLIRFKERLCGSEYGARYVRMVQERNIKVMTQTFASKIEKKDDRFYLTLITQYGVQEVVSKTLVLTTGCRERTAKQVMIHGTRPSGVYTAGTAQYFINIEGVLPVKKCVILGSGDIGLIMARRLTLEGAEVLGVYEVKPTASGLTRNIEQCLKDFDIPLYLSHTVTRVWGRDRLEGVTIARVNERFEPIEGSEQNIECDGLILSVGLIPENELAESLQIDIDPRTKGAYCDQRYMTPIDGVFVAGNALHVNDLVDYVTESGHMAGEQAAHYAKREIKRLAVETDEHCLYAVPQRIEADCQDKVAFFFRSKEEIQNKTVLFLVDDRPVFVKKYRHLRPPEMERIVVDFAEAALRDDSTLKLVIKESE